MSLNLFLLFGARRRSLQHEGGGGCTWVKTGRLALFSCFVSLYLGGHCLQMLCLPGCGTQANTQNLPHFCALPASIGEFSPPNDYFSWRTRYCQIVQVLPSHVYMDRIEKGGMFGDWWRDLERVDGAQWGTGWRVCGVRTL